MTERVCKTGRDYDAERAALTEADRESLRLTDEEREAAHEAMQEGEWQWFHWLYSRKVERIVAARVSAAATRARAEGAAEALRRASDFLYTIDATENGIGSAQRWLAARAQHVERGEP